MPRVCGADWLDAICWAAGQLHPGTGDAKLASVSRAFMHACMTVKHSYKLMLRALLISLTIHPQVKGPVWQHSLCGGTGSWCCCGC